MKRTVTQDRPQGYSQPQVEASTEAPVACKYKKDRKPSLRLDSAAVDALIESLETRNASRQAPQTAAPPPEVAAGNAASSGDGAPSDRMSDKELEEIARVLKMTRSTAPARESGLRLLVEAKRARAAEKRLPDKA